MDVGNLEWQIVVMVVVRGRGSGPRLYVGMALTTKPRPHRLPRCDSAFFPCFFCGSSGFIAWCFFCRSVSFPVRSFAAPAVASVGASISRCSFCEFHCGCCSIFDCLSCALLVCWGLSCADAISDQGKGSAGWCACRFEIKAVKYPYQKRSRGYDSSAIATKMAKLPKFNIN